METHYLKSQPIAKINWTSYTLYVYIQNKLLMSYDIEWVPFIKYYVPTQSNIPVRWLQLAMSYYCCTKCLIVVSYEQFVNKLPILEIIKRRRDPCYATKIVSRVYYMKMLNMNLHYIYRFIITKVFSFFVLYSCKNSSNLSNLNP